MADKKRKATQRITKTAKVRPVPKKVAKRTAKKRNRGQSYRGQAG